MRATHIGSRMTSCSTPRRRPRARIIRSCAMPRRASSRQSSTATSPSRPRLARRTSSSARHRPATARWASSFQEGECHRGRARRQFRGAGGSGVRRGGRAGAGSEDRAARLSELSRSGRGSASSSCTMRSGDAPDDPVATPRSSDTAARMPLRSISRTVCGATMRSAMSTRNHSAISKSSAAQLDRTALQARRPASASGPRPPSRRGRGAREPRRCRARFPTPRLASRSAVATTSASTGLGAAAGKRDLARVLREAPPSGARRAAARPVSTGRRAAAPMRGVRRPAGGVGTPAGSRDAQRSRSTIGVTMPSASQAQAPSRPYACSR